MVTPAERFQGWIDSLAGAWGDRLRGWMASWIGKGATEFLESAEPSAKDLMTDTLTKMLDSPGMTPELREAIEKSIEKGDWVATAFGYLGGFIGSIIGIMAIAGPPGRKQEYAVDRIEQSARLDPISVITAWRRDKTTYEKYFADLADQGWSDERIEALKFATLFYPSPSDLVGFLAHEVYEDDMAARYGLDADFDEVAKHLDKFEKAGMTETQVREFWRDHWEHTSYMQMVELLHRGLLTETGQPPPTTQSGWEARDAEGTQILRDWYKLVEVAEFWRDKLTAMSWNVPTRVDVRRFWDMRTISEEELRNIYHRQGYHGTDLDNYVNWTKVYTDFPMMMTRFSNGWITEEDIRKWLRGLEIPEDRIDQFIQEKTKPEKAARTTAEKDLTKTEIYKGVKKETITWSEGIDLLRDLGYDEWEAEYILAINVGVLEGSPDTYAELKDITTKWRIATGQEATPMPEEIKQAAAEVVRLTEEVDALNLSIEEERKGLLDTEVLPGEATERLTELQVTRNRVIAELERVKSEYNRLVAEWKHGLP